MSDKPFPTPNEVVAKLKMLMAFNATDEFKLKVDIIDAYTKLHEAYEALKAKKSKPYYDEAVNLEQVDFLTKENANLQQQLDEASQQLQIANDKLFTAAKYLATIKKERDEANKRIAELEKRDKPEEE